MGFTKKTWKNRIAEYINRRLITMEDGSTSLVTVARDEGTISQEGDAFNAANMNDLEDRIESEFNEINQSLTNLGATELLGYVESGKAKTEIIKDYKSFKFIFAFLWNTASNSIYGAVMVPTAFINKNTPFYVNFYDGSQAYQGTVNFLSNTQVVIDGKKSNGLHPYVIGVN